MQQHLVGGHPLLRIELQQRRDERLFLLHVRQPRVSHRAAFEAFLDSQPQALLIGRDEGGAADALHTGEGRADGEGGQARSDARESRWRLRQGQAAAAKEVAQRRIV